VTATALPPESADPLFANLRLSLGIPPSTFVGPSFTELNYLARETLRAALDPDFLREHNPVIRHTVLRRRKTLEEVGLLDRNAVEVHPRPEAPAYPGAVRAKPHDLMPGPRLCRRPA